MKYDCKREEIRPVEEVPTQLTYGSLQGGADEKWLGFSLLQVAFA
jgi:hypothetical protein